MTFYSLLGFLLTTLLFLPFGRGQLKEAIAMQLFSFFCFFIMMGIFHFELYERGLMNKLDLIGEDVWQVSTYSSWRTFVFIFIMYSFCL